MKFLSLGLSLICVTFIGCDLDVNQITSTDDGYTYDVYTYSTGWSSICKECFSMETSGLKSTQVDSVKKVHIIARREFKKIW